MLDVVRSNGESSRFAGGLRRVLVSLLLAAGVACGTDAPRENFSRPRNPRDAGPRERDGGLQDSGIRDAGTRDSAVAAALPELDLASACGERPTEAGEFSRERLRSASADCAIWQYCAFRAAARALEARTSAYANDPSPAALSGARAAWRTAMDVWSEAELFQFGPAASAAESAGKDTFQGKGFRDRIYAWPTTARCRVEEMVVEKRTRFEGVLISGRGLFAIEYGLFYAGTDTACADGSETARAWAELGEDEVRSRKAAYTAAVAKDVRTQAEALYDAWSPDAGNFKDMFVRAAGYPDEQAALNALGWALVYVEKEVKDWKLGIPAGYTLTSPVSGPETPFARIGSENIRANLRGFRALFQGCGSAGEGVGFDDWLQAAGHPELSEQLLEALGGAERTMASFGPLHDASAPQLEAAYQSVRTLTDLLKGDLFGAGSPLNLKLPSSVEGDTD
jgi:predicted lipoprotein